MKKLIVSTAAIAILGGIVGFEGTARGQSARPSSEVDHKVGLIDMAHVFKEYKKFEVLREDLKAEIQQSDDQAKTKAQGIKNLQEQMRLLKEGSPKYLEAEKELAGAASKFEAFRKVAQRNFLRRESKIYKTIYLEVTDAVQKYAGYYKYTLVLRFNREGLDNAANPQDVIKSMNRQVVYFQSDNDITESILEFLNREYDKSASGAPRTRTSSRNRPANGTRRN